MSISPETIVAEATSPAPAARAIVRLSGFNAIRLATEACDAALARERGVHSCRLRIDGMTLPGEVWVFPAPRSATGEDCVEIHVPGNRRLVTRLVQALVKAGARVAEPGEFSRRAWMRGRLDLAQAEAVMALVSSVDAEASRRALDVLEGRVSGELRRLMLDIEDLCARFEVSFDFDEEAAEQVDEDRFLNGARDLTERLEALAGKGHAISSLCPRVVLAGDANAGKSTLFNALLGRERAAVADEIGTTRDVLVEPVDLGGVSVELVDTAGFKAAENAIERQSLEGSEAAASSCDLLLLVVAADQKILSDELRQALARWQDIAGRTLLIRTKSDLAARPEALSGLEGTPGLSLSALRGDGMPELKVMLANQIRRLISPESAMVSHRAAELASHALATLKDARQALEQGLPLEIASDLARAALSDIRELLGQEASADVLDHIFSNFCIGK